MLFRSDKREGRECRKNGEIKGNRDEEIKNEGRGDLARKKMSLPGCIFSHFFSVGISIFIFGHIFIMLYKVHSAIIQTVETEQKWFANYYTLYIT